MSDLRNYFVGKDFLWGAATAAFQVEGAHDADGKGPGIWDRFLADRTDNGRVACDHYHRSPRDVALMRQLNLQAYRFSVSWPRVMPTGRGTVNPPGLDFYDRLTDQLLAAGIQPLVTLYHWDLPAALQDDLDGWAGDTLPELFADYADVIFDRLGDRVSRWITINEPWVIVMAGYFTGTHAPGIQDRPLGYRAGHNLMRAHAYAVQRYRAHRHGHGQISFALNSSYSFPASDSPADHQAAQRALLDFAGWFGDPACFGQYPDVLRERYGDLLPTFSDADRDLLRGSLDYLALNYYTSDRVAHAPGQGPLDFDRMVPDEPPRTEMDWPIMPEGFERLLLWLWDRYRLPLYITENGAALRDRVEPDGSVNDAGRIAYLRDHIAAMARAMQQGVDVRGYFAWSLIDNLEWNEGYARRFGLVRCDHQTQQRTIKASGRWYAELIRTGLLPESEGTCHA